MLTNLQEIFCCVAVKTLVGVETVGDGGGAQEVRIDLMPPGVPKVSNFSLFWIFRVASCRKPQSPPSSFSFH